VFAALLHVASPLQDFVAPAGPTHAASAEGWAMANASHTREWYSDCLTGWADPGRIHQALVDLGAQRTTAGFVALFLSHREVI
jgi:hypothetical protein